MNKQTNNETNNETNKQTNKQINSERNKADAPLFPTASEQLGAIPLAESGFEDQPFDN